ncbi:CheB methylesterase domain-containing protein [Citreimonas salinaria]|uniref:protein-glutamate methylesterase n=1 Tax=Citreimonas salinaria TaxID=321339 RepID=A0A1H3JFX2_9RHOB|nr:CheB methylesterase domain-containing protein [Citreimonas salinaria]SDY38811.1 CheB methylesterase [Citreimonas salinaria]
MQTVIVAIPDDAVRQRISEQVASLPGFRLVARTRTLMDTYNEIETRAPNVILIAESLSAMPEFEVMRALFVALDVRWLVVTSSPAASRAMQTAAAKSDLFALAHDSSLAQLEQQLHSVTRSQAMPMKAPDAEASSTPMARIDRIILIGSSTGGVDALLAILRDFPADCPPTVIVQHTGVGFGVSLAALLDRQCRASVRLVTEPTALRRGAILIGAGVKAHLQMAPGRVAQVELGDSAPVSGHVPSVDVFFESAAPFAGRVSAALLTGMGRDGATGLKTLRDAGAHTIAQDQTTSVVFGMPRAAIELGAANEVLPLDSIAGALLQSSPRRPLMERRA